MKYFASLCILFILQLVYFSTQSPKFVDCPEWIVMNTTTPCECCEVTCFTKEKGMTTVSQKACPLSQCLPGTQIGYHEDLTKEYPDCCGHPICESL